MWIAWINKQKEISEIKQKKNDIRKMVINEKLKMRFGENWANLCRLFLHKKNMKKYRKWD